MSETSIAEAKTQLTRFIHQAERGEVVACDLLRYMAGGAVRYAPVAGRQTQRSDRGLSLSARSHVAADYRLRGRAARWQAEQRAHLRQIGRSPSCPDSQIAAIAAVNELVLVTRNIEDFADFQGLQAENWFEENPSGGEMVP
jgi:predicted nucleic acid-binding protein